MKIKALVCALLIAVFTLSGCVDPVVELVNVANDQYKADNPQVKSNPIDLALPDNKRE